MKHQPDGFLRLEDGELFTINGDGTYSVDRFKKSFPGKWFPSWDLCLMLSYTMGASASYKEIETITDY